MPKLAKVRSLDPTLRGKQVDEITEDLQRLVIGQSQAVERVVDAYQATMCGMNAPHRPLASFLLLGPTGTGKTRLVEAFAQILHGSSDKMLKVNCAEFQHGHEIAKLVGSPPGYLGHRETQPMLCQQALTPCMSDKHRIALILFDEIEKAGDTLWKLLLGILDKAKMSTGANQDVDFTRCMIFLTSNLGSKEIQSALNPNLGFAPRSEVGDLSLKVNAAVRDKFTPEFLNRIDSKIVFKPLSTEDLHKILQLELGNVRRRIMEASVTEKLPRFILTVTPGVEAHIIEEGTDEKYGARHLKRVLEKLLVQPIVNLLSSGQIQDGDTIRADWDGGRMVFGFDN